MPSKQMNHRLGIGKCTYCESIAPLTFDHIEPKSKGGRFKVPACSPCNAKKRDQSPEQWDEFMRSPAWWTWQHASGKHRELFNKKTGRGGHPSCTECIAVNARRASRHAAAEAYRQRRSEDLRLT